MTTEAAAAARPSVAAAAADLPAAALRQGLPVLAVVGVLVVVWYAGAIGLNAPRVVEQLENAGDAWGWRELVAATWAMERPVLPAPHQVAANWYASVFEEPLDSKRSLLHHAFVTLTATLLGFALGIAVGVALAVAVVHSRVLDRGLLPWIIASQTVPILALAPMIVVVLGSLGYPPLASKAVISMYLCFFPIAIGMVKGLRAPDPLQLDLLRTYSATALQVLVKLRLPASVPFLFASAKVAVAASLVGAIVGELPTGAAEGLGARLLSGSYFGQTIQIWSALLMAALLGVLLVACVALAERLVLRGRAGH